MAGENETEEANVGGLVEEATSKSNTPGETDRVNGWLEKIRSAKRTHSKAFRRMRECQQIAAFGGTKEWVADEKRYVVPIVNRHINQAVSQLYARNPTAVAKRRRRLLYTAWDGTQEQITTLQGNAALGDPTAPQHLLAIRQDIARAGIQEAMLDRTAETMGVLYEYQIDEQPQKFKSSVKALVRRTKVNGVGYIKMNFLREHEIRPEIASHIEDTQAKLKAIERLMQDVMEDEDSSEADKQRHELESLMADLQKYPDRVVREQIVYDYPRSTEIILDPETRHLKTLAGCGWMAHQFDLTNEQIRDTYGFDMSEDASQQIKDTSSALDQDLKTRKYRIYEVQDKRLQQVFVVCEGHDRFLEQPAEPGIWMEGFFNIFPLVFNEIEHEEEIFPPSDVWNARHMQFEYNRSRESLREHRIAARPYFLSAKGRLEREEKDRLQNHAAHEIVEVIQTDEKQPLSSIVERGPTAPIDPNLYEVEQLHTDMLRTVGTQEANLGGTSGATATESSIAENSRMSSLSDNVDDLDDLLTSIAGAAGTVLLQEMSVERVKEIVGPGAVWPEFPMKRRQLADQIALVIKAGSSGRPNQAAKLANLERAGNILLQLPGVNPEPLAESYADLLDIEHADLMKQGVMSITAQNALAGSPTPMGGTPEAQGAAGADNAPKQPGSGQGQPSYQAPGDGQ